MISDVDNSAAIRRNFRDEFLLNEMLKAMSPFEEQVYWIFLWEKETAIEKGPPEAMEDTSHFFLIDMIVYVRRRRSTNTT